MRPRILLVDDDPKILEIFSELLRDQFELEIATGGEQGLNLVANSRPFDVIVADMQMSGMNGIEFLKQAQTIHPDTVRMMLTGYADQRTAIEAINKGQVFQFLTKPCPPSILTLALEAGVNQHRLVTAERELLEKTLSGSIKMLTELLSMVEPHSFSLSQKLRDQIRKIAQRLNITAIWEWEAAAMLCQIGAVTIPASVIQKHRARQALGAAEREMLARIPEVGFNLLANIPRLESVARIVLYQNKLFSGAGFPLDGCAGEDIPQASRVLKILIDKAGLAASGLSAAAQAEQLRSRAGWYDPHLLEPILAAFESDFAARNSATPTSQAVSWKDLKAGHLLVSDIQTKDGWLIVTAGNRISPMLLMRLKNFAELSGIREPIYIASS